MAGLKNYLVIVVMVLVEGLEGVEEDNMAMESMVDDDYDFAAFLAKAGEVLGDPHGGDSWGNRVEEVVPKTFPAPPSSSSSPRGRVSLSRTRASQSRKANQRLSTSSQLEAAGRTRASKFQVDPLVNVTRSTGDFGDRLLW